MPGTALFIAAGVVGAILIVAAWSYSRRKRSEAHTLSDQLREQFGPEYDRTVAELGNTRRAEAALTTSGTSPRTKAGATATSGSSCRRASSTIRPPPFTMPKRS